MGLLLAQHDELGFDARLQVIALNQQQLAEKGLLGLVHIISRWLSEQVLFSHQVGSRVRLYFDVIV